MGGGEIDCLNTTPLNPPNEKNGTESKWDLFFDGWSDMHSKLLIWTIKDELSEALKKTGLTGENQFPEEIPYSGLENLTEGAKKTIQVNSYERNPKARQKCIDYWSATCSVCGFDFGKVYGEIGEGFIHVHHLVPLSAITQAYRIDPVQDLRPVCPNCHAMLHIKNPPLTIEQLKWYLKISQQTHEA